MEKKEIAKIINKDIKTLYNWEKNNPELYKIIEYYFKNDGIGTKEKELLQNYRKLTEKEKDYYLYDIKARVLRNEIKEN